MQVAYVRVEITPLFTRRLHLLLTIHLSLVCSLPTYPLPFEIHLVVCFSRGFKNDNLGYIFGRLRFAALNINRVRFKIISKEIVGYSTHSLANSACGLFALDARAPAGYYTVACAAATGTGRGFPLMNCAQLPLDHYSNYCEGLAGVLATAPPVHAVPYTTLQRLLTSFVASFLLRVIYLALDQVHLTAHIVNLYFVLTTLF